MNSRTLASAATRKTNYAGNTLRLLPAQNRQYLSTRPEFAQLIAFDFSIQRRSLDSQRLG